MNPICANPTKWSNTLKQFVGNFSTNCLSVFDHFVRLVLNGLNYFIRTIPGISQFLDPLEETVRNKFIPAIIGGNICNNNKQQLLSLPTSYGGFPVETGRKLNVYKTFRRRPGRLLNVLCTFNLRPVSTGLAIPIFHELVETEFENSRKITSELIPLIIN